MTNTDFPTIGSMVHYVMPGGDHRPALVLHTNTECEFDLKVFDYDTYGGDYNREFHSFEAKWDEGKAPHTWHIIEPPEVEEE